MADQTALLQLRRGVTSWNRWRSDANPAETIDLTQASLIAADLAGADLSGVDLTRAKLMGADLSGASLVVANLRNADLSAALVADADLSGARLARANLVRASLVDAKCVAAILSDTDLTLADLSRADLQHADLSGATLTDTKLERASLRWGQLQRVLCRGTRLDQADLTNATLGRSLLPDVDLREAIGLEHVVHTGPSSVGLDTLYRSAGEIPATFLRGCGVPDEMIKYLPSLVGAAQAINFYSCFISYSTRDEDFAKRLHGRLRAEHVRVWFAPEDVKGGEKLREQIDQAIELHDRLLLVISDYSLASQWVVTEVRRALAQERKQSRRKLFPILLGPYELLEAWDAFDPASGTYLRDEIREYFIPDFSRWKDHDTFEAAFMRLLRDLRAAEERSV